MCGCLPQSVTLANTLGLPLPPASAARVCASALSAPVPVLPAALGGPVGSGCRGNVSVLSLSLFGFLLISVTEHLLEEAESRKKQFPYQPPAWDGKQSLKYMRYPW